MENELSNRYQNLVYKYYNHREGKVFEGWKSNFYFLTSIILFTLVYNVQGQSLEEYQLQASEKNPGLKASYKTFEAALHRVDQAKALQDPTLSFGYFISPVETRVGPQQAKLSLSQMLPWFGSRALQAGVAALQAEAQYESFLNKKNQLSYQVAAAYYPLYELQRLKTIEAENISLLERLKRLSTQKFEQSEGALVDVIRIDIILEESKTTLAVLKEQEQSLQFTFNNLLNRAADAIIVLPDSLALPSTNVLTETLTESHPEIKALLLKEQASQKAGLLAQKRGLPKIGVGLDYVFVGKRTDIQNGMDGNGKDAFMPMVSISLPIFRKSYKAAVKESELMQENYQLQQQQTKNMLNSELSIGQFELQKQQQLLQLYTSQLRSSVQALRLYETAYANGSSRIEELISMQQKLLQYRKKIVNSQTTYFIAQAKITYLTGEQH